MLKALVTAALFTGVVASSLLGFGSTVATAAPAAPKAPVVTFNSWQKDVVYVYDTTSTIKKSGAVVWPVLAAAERWDDGSPVDFRYTTKPCPAKSQCVIVRQQELASPTVGLTAIGRVGTDIKSVTVTLDTTFGRTNTAAKRLNVTCHELGHALGLKHRTAKSTCLTSYASTVTKPDATDIKNLNAMYGWR